MLSMADDVFLSDSSAGLLSSVSVGGLSQPKLLQLLTTQSVSSELQHMVPQNGGE